MAYVLAVIGFLAFGLMFAAYVTTDYKAFISSYAWREGWSGEHLLAVFGASGVRFSLRLAYVVSFVGLFFLRRWGVYLCVLAWLGQLLPSLFYAHFNEGMLSSNHLDSFGEFLVYLIVITWCWPVLQRGRILRSCVEVLVGVVLLHLVAFSIIYHSSVPAAATEDPERQEKLWQAVHEGNIEEVKTLLEDAAFRPKLRAYPCRPNAICNLMSYAVQYQENVEIIRMLQHAGSPLDEADGGTGDTPIIRAMLAGHPEIAAYLAREGTDPLRTNRFGVPAFIVASGQGTPDILRVMVDAGAPVNMRQRMPNMGAKERGSFVGGVTPLMISAAHGRKDLMATLLENGADPSLVDDRGRDVIAYVKMGVSPNLEPDVDALIRATTVHGK